MKKQAILFLNGYMLESLFWVAADFTAVLARSGCSDSLLDISEDPKKNKCIV